MRLNEIKDKIFDIMERQFDSVKFVSDHAAKHLCLFRKLDQQINEIKGQLKAEVNEEVRAALLQQQLGL